MSFREVKILVSVEGIYHNGCVEITEDPSNIPEGTRVIVTFVGSNEIDLESQGIDREHAKVLKANLAPFSDDWDSPEMSIYDNYDDAKANLEAR